MSDGILVLTASDVEALLPPAACAAAVEDAFRRWALGEVEAPGVLGVHGIGGGFHIKAGAMTLAGRGWFAAKVNGNFPTNPDRFGLASIQGVVVLSDASTGTPLALLDSGRLTELRTAAATAVAARWLARADASSVTLVGCGAQAASQLRALAAVRRLSTVRLLDQVPWRAHALAALLSRELEARVEVASDLADAVGAADVCITCTTSKRPFLTADMVRPGAFVAAVGADNPEKREVASALLAASRVVVDSLEQCAAIGDLHHALAEGAMRREDVHAELGQVVAGLRPGRVRDDETFVFDSTGTALQDVAAAAIVYERAVAEGRGASVKLA